MLVSHHYSLTTLVILVASTRHAHLTLCASLRLAKRPSAKKSHLPTLGTMQELLASFVFDLVDDFFIDPELVQVKAFVSVKTESRTGLLRHSKSAMDKRLTTAFVAQYLALLLILCEQENKDCKNTKLSRKFLEDLSNLEKAFAALNKIYKLCLTTHQAVKHAELNKKHCTSLLDYQLMGVPLQQSFRWATFACNRNMCPICKDSNTMRVQMEDKLAMVNDLASHSSQTASKKNSQLKSAQHGCYCFQFNCKGNIDGESCFLCKQ
jgi:hypothetical protein